MYKARSGFTLVELLIVIVIIGILAAITTVAYNGIQDHAEASRASATVESYVKLLRLYKVDHNDYPATDNEQYGETCLGKPSDFPATGTIGAGLCLQGQGSNTFTIAVSQAVNDKLAVYGTASSTELHAYTLGNEVWRGVRYTYTLENTYNPTPIIQWAVPDGQSCAPVRGNANGGTCEFALCDVPNPVSTWCPSHGL